MALPKLIYDFLNNLRIPFFGVFSLSTGVSVACSVGLLPASFTHRVSALGLVSGAATAVVSVPVLIDNRNRLAALNRQLQIFEATRVQQFGSEEVQRQEDSRPTVQLTVASEAPENWSRPKYAKPIACKDCCHYHGRIYRSHWGDLDVETVESQFVCAVHPYGPDGKSCPDWESVPHEYHLIRLQGSGISCFYFVEIDGKTLAEMLEEGIEIDMVEERHVIEALCRKFQRKSVNGLPGCTFESRQPSIELAFQELLDSCPQ